MTYNEFDALLSARNLLIGVFSEPTQYTNLPKEHLLSYLKDRKQHAAQLGRRIDRLIQGRMRDIDLFSKSLSQVVELDEDQLMDLYRQYASLYIHPGREFSTFSKDALTRVVEVAMETLTND